MLYMGTSRQPESHLSCSSVIYIPRVLRPCHAGSSIAIAWRYFLIASMLVLPEWCESTIFLYAIAVGERAHTISAGLLCYSYGYICGVVWESSCLFYGLYVIRTQRGVLVSSSRSRFCMNFLFSLATVLFLRSQWSFNIRIWL